ncbi:MAG: hypothetical protein KIG23_07985 [Erysipelotrichaceae bacterium]|nr:hypothetical protein [Erysipelotrichaceae bacterium]
MKELIEKLNSMTEEEAKTYIESLNEEEKKALKEYLNNNELDDETLDKVAGGGLTFSSGIAQML